MLIWIYAAVFSVYLAIVPEGKAEAVNANSTGLSHRFPENEPYLRQTNRGNKTMSFDVATGSLMSAQLPKGDNVLSSVRLLIQVVNGTVSPSTHTIMGTRKQGDNDNEENIHQDLQEPDESSVDQESDGNSQDEDGDEEHHSESDNESAHQISDESGEMVNISLSGYRNGVGSVYGRRSTTTPYIGQKSSTPKPISEVSDDGDESDQDLDDEEEGETSGPGENRKEAEETDQDNGEKSDAEDEEEHGADDISAECDEYCAGEALRRKNGDTEALDQRYASEHLYNSSTTQAYSYSPSTLSSTTEASYSRNRTASRLVPSDEFFDSDHDENAIPVLLAPRERPHPHPGQPSQSIIRPPQAINFPVPWNLTKIGPVIQMPIQYDRPHVPESAVGSPPVPSVQSKVICVTLNETGRAISPVPRDLLQAIQPPVPHQQAPPVMSMIPIPVQPHQLVINLIITMHPVNVPPPGPISQNPVGMMQSAPPPNVAAPGPTVQNPVGMMQPAPLVNVPAPVPTVQNPVAPILNQLVPMPSAFNPPVVLPPVRLGQAELQPVLQSSDAGPPMLYQVQVAPPYLSYATVAPLDQGKARRYKEESQVDYSDYDERY